ncbi:MAG TPA: hypothetical protein VKU00_09025 [Chthonomonadaceae bacterium]|nr:hypothetical protein [Chthonomonadaceae bacterium]
MQSTCNTISAARSLAVACALGIGLACAGCSHGSGTVTTTNTTGGNSAGNNQTGNNQSGSGTTTLTPHVSPTMPGVPTGVTGDIGAGRAYVTVLQQDKTGHITGGTVVVLDLATDAIVTSISTLTASQYPPRYPTLNTGTKKLYFGLGDRVGIADVSKNTLLKTIKLPQQYETVSDVAVDPTTNRVYIACGNVGASPTVAIIDGAADTILKEVPVAQGGLYIRVNPATHRVFVGAQDYTDPSDTTPCKIYELAGDTGALISTNAYAGVLNGIALCGATNQLAVSVSPGYSQGGDLRILTPDKHVGRDTTRVITLSKGYTVHGTPFTTKVDGGVSDNIYIDAQDASGKDHLLIFSTSDLSLLQDVTIPPDYFIEAGFIQAKLIGWGSWVTEIANHTRVYENGQFIEIPEPIFSDTPQTFPVADVKIVTQ